MSKELEAWKEIKWFCYKEGNLDKQFNIIEKSLKALEIIKKYPEQLLDIDDTDNYNEYLDLDYAPDQYLSEENYYLLKEVLS